MSRRVGTNVLLIRRRAVALVLAAATLVVPLLAATPAVASATFYREWTLSGVTFDDGGTLSGSLVITDDGTPVRFDVTTSGGNTGLYGTTNYAGTPSFLLGIGGWYVWAPGGFDQYLLLALPDTTGATSGTTLALSTQSYECTNCGNVRYVTAGSIVAGGEAGAATALDLSSDASPAGLGSTVTFTAAVSSGGGTPGGQVAFRDTTTSTDLCDAYLDGSGSATCSTSTLGLGHHTIHASFASSPSFRSSTDTIDQVIDPVLAIGLRAGAQQMSGRLGATLHWAHSAQPTATYRLQVRLHHAGSWGAWHVLLTGLDATTQQRSFWTQHDVGYQFRVRSQRGNSHSEWTYSSPVLPRIRDAHDTSVSTTGTWRTHAVAGSVGGTWLRSTDVGATATTTLRGTAYALLMATGKGEGIVGVCLDPSGANICRTIDLSQPSGSSSRAVFTVNNLAAARRTVVVTVLSGRVDLDAFAVLGAPLAH